jgi:ACR3 family arsenite efflux pump ArsB
MLLGTAFGAVVHVPQLRGLVPVTLFFILYPTMLAGNGQGFANTVRQPGILCAALALNFVLAPLLIAAVTLSLNTPWLEAYAPGVVLYGVIPCGGMTPVFAILLGGDISLAVSIMILCLCLSAILAPPWLEALAGAHLAVPLGIMAKSLAISIFLPLLVARASALAITRFKGREALDRFRARCAPLSKWGVMSMMFIVFSLSSKVLMPNLGRLAWLFPQIALFHLVLWAAGMAIGSLARWPQSSTTSLAVCSTVKNNALAAAMSAMILDPSVAAVTAALGPLVQFPLMLTLIRLRQRS